MEDWEWDLLNDLIRREEDTEQLQSFREIVTEGDLGDLASASRAIALCHLEGDSSPDAFMAWFEEPERAKEAARKWLAPGVR